MYIPVVTVSIKMNSFIAVVVWAPVHVHLSRRRVFDPRALRGEDSCALSVQATSLGVPVQRGVPGRGELRVRRRVRAAEGAETQGECTLRGLLV